jgi:hypothetical protein
MICSQCKNNIELKPTSRSSDFNPGLGFHAASSSERFYPSQVDKVVSVATTTHTIELDPEFLDDLERVVQRLRRTPFSASKKFVLGYQKYARMTKTLPELDSYSPCDLRKAFPLQAIARPRNLTVNSIVMTRDQQYRPSE